MISGRALDKFKNPTEKESEKVLWETFSDTCCISQFGENGAPDRNMHSNVAYDVYPCPYEYYENGDPIPRRDKTFEELQQDVADMGVDTTVTEN